MVLGTILQVAKDEAASHEQLGLHQVPLGSFVHSSLTELVWILLLTFVISLPGQLNEKGPDCLQSMAALPPTPLIFLSTIN